MPTTALERAYGKPAGARKRPGPGQGPGVRPASGGARAKPGTGMKGAKGTKQRPVTVATMAPGGRVVRGG
eukprot:CAMPEP_0119513196 /NCGR_PEP_ID=MMETSP1344-20130328/31378_1 /TAXON_ID=236787 /ORGANISM="Florenciella parvula, Strain CCMP2471" /LENGTH=69 /DNA_ID=CAMNT_0007550391 /DNA_START=11 /DNA_END=217 /DNA_ORIENTATION=-